MKKFYAYLLCAVGIPFIAVDVCNAQSATLVLKAPPANVAIDGSAQEWGDSLAYYNPEKKIHYTLANDKTNLYLVVKVKDPVLEGNILAAGLTFSVDVKGRKKSTYSTTFPATNPAAPVLGNPSQETLEQKTLRASVTRFKKIGVSGFKDIDDETISPSTNAFGIQTAISYDDKGNLIYEEVIPLMLFHAGDLTKGEWAFNIKINGIERSTTSSDIAGAPASGTTSAIVGRSSSGGGGRSSGGRKSPDATAGMLPSNQQSTPTTDFWGKFSLSPAQ